MNFNKQTELEKVYERIKSIEFELEDRFVTVDDDLSTVNMGDLCMNEDLEMFNIGDMKILNAGMTGSTVYKVLAIKLKQEAKLTANKFDISDL